MEMKIENKDENNHKKSNLCMQIVKISVCEENF